MRGFILKSLSRVVKYITERACAGFKFACKLYIQVDLGFA